MNLQRLDKGQTSAIISGTMLLSSRECALRLTSFALVTLVAFGSASVFTSCGKPKKVKWIPPEQRKNKIKLPPEEQFREARLLMMDGRNQDAAEMLRELESRPNLPQPLQNWITVFTGMAEFQSGNDDAGRAMFAKLVQRGSLSKDGSTEKLTTFFVDVGQRMSDKAPIPSGISSKYDKFNHEALALYLYALQSESMENFEDALAFYRQFTTTASRGQEGFPGLNVYLNYARGMASGLLDYEDEVESGSRSLAGKGNAVTPEDRKKIVDAAKSARVRVKQRTKLTASLDEKLKTIEGRVGEQVRMSEEDADADAKVLPEAKAKWKKLMADYKFIDAKKVITEPELRSPNAKKEQDTLAARTSYLENYKFYLIQELAVAGYPEEITMKDGKTVKGKITRLDDNEIKIEIDGKATGLPWTEITPESVYAMGKYLVTPDEEADAQGFRKWHLGNFAGFIGKSAEAKALLTEAAKLNPAYQADLPQALEWVDKPTGN